MFELESGLGPIPSSSIDNRCILRESSGFSTVLPSSMRPLPQSRNLSRVSEQIPKSRFFSEAEGPLYCCDCCSSSIRPSCGLDEAPHEDSGKLQCSVPSTVVPRSHCESLRRHLESETPFRLTSRISAC